MSLTLEVGLKSFCQQNIVIMLSLSGTPPSFPFPHVLEVVLSKDPP